MRKIITAILAVASFNSFAIDAELKPFCDKAGVVEEKVLKHTLRDSYVASVYQGKPLGLSDKEARTVLSKLIYKYRNKDIWVPEYVITENWVGQTIVKAKFRNDTELKMVGGHRDEARRKMVSLCEMAYKKGLVDAVRTNAEAMKAKLDTRVEIVEPQTKQVSVQDMMQQKKLEYISPEVCKTIGSPKGMYILNFIKGAEGAVKKLGKKNRSREDTKHLYKDAKFIASALDIDHSFFMSEALLNKARVETRDQTKQIITKQLESLSVDKKYQQENVCRGYYARVHERIRYQNALEDAFDMFMPRVKAYDAQRLKAKAEKDARLKEIAKEKAEAKEQAKSQEKAAAAEKKRIAPINSEIDSLTKELRSIERKMSKLIPRKTSVIVKSKMKTGAIQAIVNNEVAVIIDVEGVVKKPGYTELYLVRLESAFTRTESGFEIPVTTYGINAEPQRKLREYKKSAKGKADIERINEIKTKLTHLKSKL